MGIKDLHCKVEGSTKNVQAVTRAFFDALVHQVCNILNYCQVVIQTLKMLLLMVSIMLESRLDSRLAFEDQDLKVKDQGIRFCNLSLVQLYNNKLKKMCL